jgi:hypothetical protein
MLDFRCAVASGGDQGRTKGGMKHQLSTVPLNRVGQPTDILKASLKVGYCFLIR